MYRRSCVEFAHNPGRGKSDILDLQAAAEVIACDNTLCELVHIWQDHEDVMEDDGYAYA